MLDYKSIIRLKKLGLNNCKRKIIARSLIKITPALASWSNSL
jgi:hypothetical protein